ncbi:unnamed protein product [Pylaiella littoralis]
MDNQTPYFRMYGKQASLHHVRVIGSAAFVHVETHTAKLGQRAWEGRLVGYSPNSNAYRVYNPHTKRVVSSRIVTLIETMDVADSTSSINYGPIHPDRLGNGEPSCDEGESKTDGCHFDDKETSGDVESDTTSDNEKEFSNEDGASSEEPETEDEDSDYQAVDDGVKATRSGLRSSSRDIDQDPTTPMVGMNKRQQAELRRLAPSGLASYARERIRSPALDEPVRPPASIPTPNTYQEAMRSVNAEQWKAAMYK